jgi:hypothetical protein
LEAFVFLRRLMVVISVVLFTACGGGGGGNTTSNTTATITGASGSAGSGNCDSAAGSGSQPGQAVVIPVCAGATQTGINLTVPPPASSPALIAQVLGVGSSATNTGAQIHQGENGSVFLCGTGFAGNLQVSISGPGDITVGTPQLITCLSGSTQTSGIQFPVNVSAGASLGGRTVLVTNSQQDMTAFAGGLEVIP